MELNWLQSILYGFVAGLTDILPVSSQVHKVLLLKFFGIKSSVDMLNMLIHCGVLGGLYFSCRGTLTRFSKAQALARIPKRRRKRPLDVKTLMDISLLRTMMVPVVLAMLAYRFVLPYEDRLVLLSAFLFLNGVLLYVPQFMPSGNKDARNMSRLEGLLMGLGGGAAILPGVSALGASTSVGYVCGADRSYSLNMALLMDMGVTVGFLIYDVAAIAANGIGAFSFVILLRYLVSAGMAFLATVLAIHLLRVIAKDHTFALFGLYSFGLALFTFILNLMA